MGQCAAPQVVAHYFLSDIDRMTFPGLLSDTFMSGIRVKLSVLDRVSTGRRFLLTQTVARLAATALLLAVCANILYAGQPKPKKRDNRHEIEQLEEAWRNAALKSDTNAMSALLADDYIAITASGTLQTKEEALASLRSGRVHFTALDVSDRKLRFYGETALVTSKANVKASNGSSDLTGSFRYTRVYVLNPQGQWKVVSFEASRIREPGQHRPQVEQNAGGKAPDAKGPPTE
jgi:ketosteroid isomerase-like protein